jgi:CRISPR/Cas system-associated endonuclease Cas1
MLEIAKEIITLKTRNQLSLLKSIRKKDEELKKEIENINILIKKIPEAQNYDNLLGYE